MIWDRTTPCKSCPYRKDAKLRLWHKSEFENLLKQDEPMPGTDVSMGHLFGCHEFNKRPPEERRPCAGWLLDQKRRGVPSLRLRLAFSNKLVRDCFDKAGAAGLKMFRTIQSMARANGVKIK